MNVVIRFPVTGWCVRPGTLRAHFLFLHRGRPVSACGGLERGECYIPKQLRPLQADKPRCQRCEQELRRAQRSYGDAA